MKNRIAMAVVLLLGLFSEGRTQGVLPREGRFQLYQLQHDVITTAGIGHVVDAFRIDTQTGQTMRLMDVFPREGSKEVLRWMSVEEPENGGVK